MKEKHFCTCCLSDECYKDMANYYYFGNRTENYSEMLMNTFNIHIKSDGVQRNLICEECVSKLQDAAAFRRKVLDIQTALKSSIEWDHVAMEFGMKIKDSVFNDNCNLELNDTIDERHLHWENFTDTENGQTFVISLNHDSRSNVNKKSVFFSNKNKTMFREKSNESSSKARFRNKSVSTVNSTIKTVKKSNLNVTDSRLNLQLPTENHGLMRNINENNDVYASLIGSENYFNDDDDDFENDQDVGSEAVKSKDGAAKQKRNKMKKEERTELHLKYKSENTLKLIQNSNLCLFRSFRNKFGCMFCPLKFPLFSDLREHSSTHSNLKPLSLIVSRLRGSSCKNAEITDLKCNKCSENCTNLTILIEHLKNKHDISLRGTEHYLVPYKLQDGCPYQCLLCEEKFKSYMKLSIHMNSHFPYNVCEICGKSFINRRCLRMHVQCQHKEKKCSKCPAIFLTSASRIKHLRQVHGIKNWKRYCNLCNKHFPYAYLVDEHKIKEHGFKRPICICPECGKTFCSPINLKTHIRSVHIKERNYPCTKCGLRFFTKCDQKRHERTHEEFRSFCCTYCESKFKTKDSWRRHLRRQHGHVFGGPTSSKSDCNI